MYHAESKVAVNLMGARPENTMPGLGDKFHHSGERLINLCILFDQENIELAEMAKFSIQGQYFHLFYVFRNNFCLARVRIL